MKKIKIGLLPFWIKLYDDVCGNVRPSVEAFYKTIVKEYEKRGITVFTAPVCRLKNEFNQAIKRFEEDEVDAIVTLHLAYSPSLESSEILARTFLPLIVLDTTPDFAFDCTQKGEAIMGNHGIHGVQDMCNLLIRNGKKFLIEAGHWKESDVIDRTVQDCIAVRLVKNMQHSRVGIIGKPFAGMGDFAVDFAILKKTIGMDVIESVPADFANVELDTEDRIIAEDNKKYNSVDLCDVVHRRSIKVYLQIKKWLVVKKLDAFTFNFLDLDHSGLETAPFYAACKAMAEGIGYAGEGDVLTAAFVGAFISEFPETTFTEMFCPNWKDNSIFMSHMGEIGLNVCDGKVALLEKEFIYGKAENPAYFAGRMKPGKAALLNLAPGPENRFSLIAVPVEIGDSKGAVNMKGSIAGWFKPSMDLPEFLQEYSLHGGTHHSALVYNCNLDIIKNFARLMGWKFKLISNNETETPREFSKLH
ncbi:MAG: hypothetical protein WCS73_12695 [Lentisphaeria bacterium]